MTIYLIRHGKTIANEKHLYCGSTDLPLSPTGAAALKMLHYPHCGGFRFISSGMRRCNETLTILFGETDYEVIPEFREVDFGSFEMGSYEQLKHDRDYIAWISGDNDANIPPNGESGNQMTRRVLAAFAQVTAAGKDCVIVTHGGVIAAIMAQLFPEEGKNRYQWQSAPGEGYRLILGQQNTYTHAGGNDFG